MKIKYNISENSLTIHVIGRLDTTTSPELDKLLAKLLSSGRITEIHFEFGRLEYISSSGLRVLLAALKKIGPYNGKAYIENANNIVQHILSMTGFHSLFEIIPADSGNNTNPQ